MTISIFTTDANLIVRSWEPRLAEMTGMPGENVCGLPISQVIPDLTERGLERRFQRVLQEGVIETLAPALHRYLIACDPVQPSKYFTRMQQRVTIAPLREKEIIIGTIVTIEDVTTRLESERELAELMMENLPSEETADLQANLAQLTNGKDDHNDLTFAEHPLMSVLQNQSWQMRREAVQHLSHQGNLEITEELVELLRKEHRNPAILNSVLQVLVSSNIDPVPALLVCLQEKNPDLRIYSALALGERRDERAVPGLLDALSDPDQNVRYHTIEALGRIQAKDAIEPLLKIAGSGDFFLAFPALDALMQIGDANVALQLISLLENTMNWRIRRETIDSLAMQNNPQITADLLRLLREQHRNPSVLNSVLQVLALSNIDPIPSLIECLKDPDPDLRVYTALALGERHDPRSIPFLLESLNDPETNVRYHSIEALGHLQATEAVEAFSQIAISGDFFLSFPALEALARIGDATVAPILVPLLDDELLGAQVANTLSKLGDADVIIPMVNSLNQSHAVREIAMAIQNIHERYQSILGEGTHIEDLTSENMTEAGLQNLIKSMKGAKLEELISLVHILGWLRGEAVEQSLINLLGNPELRDLILKTLVTYTKRQRDRINQVVNLLLEQLLVSDLVTQKVIAMALGRIGSNQSVPELIKLLQGEPELVIVVATALAQIGDQRAFTPLLELLGNSDIGVRLATIASLNSLGHPDLPNITKQLLVHPHELVRESAVKIAGYFAFNECVEELLARTNDPDERVRRAAIEHLPYLENEVQVLGILQAKLQDPAARVRVAAAHALGEMETPLVLSHLLTALDDPDNWVRYYAVGAITKYWQTHRDTLETDEIDNIDIPSRLEVFDRLQELAKNDQSPPVQAVTATALGNIGGISAIPLLTELTNYTSGEGEVARAAIMVLGEIDSAQVVPPLLTALNSANPERRLDAIHAFRERGGSEAGIALQWMAAADPEAKVVQAALDSLARMSSRESIYSLLELTVDPASRDLCIMALANRGGLGLKATDDRLAEDYIEAIAQGLHHVHSNVRCATIEVLTRLKHPFASDLLINTLDDQDANVRLSAINALGHLGNRSCEERLTALARNDDNAAVRRAAQKVLHRY